MALTPKQQLFCDEYLIDLNATQAAIRAGYSAKTAYSIGERLLRNVEIQEVLQELKKERHERTKINADYVLQRLGSDR
jgi:phage terminase small subunit